MCDCYQHDQCATDYVGESSFFCYLGWGDVAIFWGFGGTRRGKLVYETWKRLSDMDLLGDSTRLKL